MLSDVERERYSRQIRLFAEEGQERLKKKRVFVAGAGGLGSIVSLYLAALGFGRIRIADCDSVELSNLNRQILHSSSGLGQSKAQSALKALSDINPEVEVEVLQEKISEGSVDRLLQGCDMIMDAMDNFPTRYLLNCAALKRDIPLFHGAISGFQGQATTIVPGRTACLRCIFPRAPPAQTSPSLGPTCGIIGSIQVNEALKFALGRGELLEDRLVLWDGLSSSLDEISCERNLSCPDCGHLQRIGRGDR